MAIAIPDDLVVQFRTIALERLAHVESAWAIVLSSLDDDSAQLIHREIHTLKGESRMLGFTDVNMVCHKLEDLLEVARSRGYNVDEDFDLAVNMALRFMAMLVRKKIGAQLQGIDLPGFIKQIDALLADAKPEPRSQRSTGSNVALRPNQPSTRIPGAVRARLAPLAVDVFIEYAAARGVKRDRLRGAWQSLRDMIGIQRAVIGAGQLAKHRSNALSLARDLGKEIEVAFDIDTAEVSAELFAALDSAVLHLVRNAVDHGIEAPAARVAGGKHSVGKIRVHCGVRRDKLVVSVEDDGRGVAIDDVIARAIELGLVASNGADRERWFELICQPGFSTRAEASDVSGRGVGLDVVRSSIVDIGGTFNAVTRDGGGTTWSVEVPLPRLTITGHVLRIAGVPFPVVIDEGWTLVDDDRTAQVIDLAQQLGLADEASEQKPRYFTNGRQTIGIRCGREPSSTQVRRLVAVPAPANAELVLLDTVEGLLLHPDRMAKPARASSQPSAG